MQTNKHKYRVEVVDVTKQGRNKQKQPKQTNTTGNSNSNSMLKEIKKKTADFVNQNKIVPSKPFQQNQMSKHPMQPSLSTFHAPSVVRN
jgi:hypothetical protein